MSRHRTVRCAGHSQVGASIALLLVMLSLRRSASQERHTTRLLPSNDAVAARVFDHNGDASRPLVLGVDRSSLPAHVWNRVKNLVAFRMHRQQPDGTTVVDAPIYLVRDSALYVKAARALRNRTTHDEYVWCLLAAVFAHEAAHKTPMTEFEALNAEAEQLRRCLFAGHLHTGSGWSAGAYLLKVEAQMRQPREHH